ncbi:helix-turn-helix transcriptional regulator [Aliiroseovarius lamellibrachiae]|uniref:helix-turn-helix transcriptional regulator n=1 Tax=Aliiroseovarius lamellibrachiae TaxID=1924933 RepID=UPI001BDFAFB8|nr:LuxR family transcriptional regulator [Aliiroseovarius lamellibrachiae]MBT2132055.1 autoinducer binding domain-containing protein [Aliiroseovarius lamellibrachiae]
MSFLELLKDVCACATLQQVWQIQRETFESYGFDRIIYGYSRYFTPNSFGPREDILLLSNHDAEYLRSYTSDEMYFHSPMAIWAAENTGSCSWRWIRENAELMGDQQQAVLSVNRKMGVTAGYTISFPSATSRTRGVLAATGRKEMDQDEVDEIWVEHGRDIEVFANVTHLKMISLPIETQRQPLTPRQREALEWVSDGKTTQDIATIMSVSAATVEKHLRIAREKLGVDSTAQAVAKASFLNQIYLLPGSDNSNKISIG